MITLLDVSVHQACSFFSPHSSIASFFLKGCLPRVIGENWSTDLKMEEEDMRDGGKGRRTLKSRCVYFHMRHVLVSVYFPMFGAAVYYPLGLAIQVLSLQNKKTCFTQSNNIWTVGV